MTGNDEKLIEILDFIICPFLLAIFDSFFCLLDCFSTLQIHFVKRKKQLTERTVYSTCFFLKCWSSTLDACENASNIIQHEKKLKKCWMNVWTDLNFHPTFFTKKCCFNFIQHSPQTHPTFFFLTCWMMLDQHGLVFPDLKSKSYYHFFIILPSFVSKTSTVFVNGLSKSTIIKCI